MKKQFETGSSSARTHRLTQPSSTLNRRYVGRPTNLAIEEAARMADYLDQHSSAPAGRPSRLVNLRVHNDDLEQMRAIAEAEEEEARQEAARKVAAERKQKAEAEARMRAEEQAREAMQQALAMHKVVELGGDIPPAPLPEEEPEESYSMSSPTIETDIYSMAPSMTHSIEPIASEPSYPVTMTPSTESVVDDISDEDIAALESNNASAMMAPVSTPRPVKNADLDTRALAMSIAADYTAASLGATMANLPTGIEEVDTSDLAMAASEVQAADSIDQIANTVATYVNKIRESSDPEEISIAIKDLKDYAEAIKQNSDLPEIAELGDTIEKFIAVTEKSTGIKAAEQKKPALVPKVESTAKKTNKVSSKIALKTSRNKVAISKSTPAKSQALMTARAVKASRSSGMSISNGRRAMALPSGMSSAKMRNPSSMRKLNNDEALRKTMRKVARMEESEPRSKSRQKSVRKQGSVKRFLLAFGCAAACVAGIIYVVTSNVPDISVRVAAMQAGVESSYPSYVPTEFSLTDIKSDDKEIILTFTNAKEQTFTLSEKKSAWDSAALERNLVKKSWDSDYSTTHEQGITMYIHNSSAAWVNGGVLYQITADDEVLTKKQLRSIATSMQ